MFTNIVSMCEAITGTVKIVGPLAIRDIAILFCFCLSARLFDRNAICTRRPVSVLNTERMKTHHWKDFIDHMNVPAKF